MNLLRFQINDFDVALSKDFRLKIIENSPYLEPEQQGSMSMPFSFPVEGNQYIFAHAQNPQSDADRKQNYDARLWCGGFLLLEGKFRLENITSETYDGNVIITPGNLSPDVWNRLCTSFDIGTITLPTTEVRSNFYNLEIPPEQSTRFGRAGSVFKVRINGVLKLDYTYPNEQGLYSGYDQFSGYLIGQDRSPALGQLSQQWQRRSNDVTLVGTQNNAISVIEGALAKPAVEFNGQQFQEMLDTNSNAPNFLMVVFNNSLGFVTPNTVSDYTIEIEISFLYGPDNRERYVRTYQCTRVVYQSPSPWPNSTIFNDPDNSEIAFPTVHNPEFYDVSKNKNWFGYINTYENNQGYRVNDERARTGFSLVPFLWLRTAMSKLVTAVGFQLQGPLFLNDSRLKNLLLYNSASLDTQVTGTKIPFITWRNVIRLADHLPNLTLKEFFDGIGNTFCIRVNWDKFNGVAEIVFLRDLLSAIDPEDWSERVSRRLEIPNDDKARKAVSWSLDSTDSTAVTTDALFESQPAEAVIKATEAPYERYATPFAPLQQLTVAKLSEQRISFRPNGSNDPVATEPPATYRLFPMLKQRGKSSLYEQNEVKTAPRLMFWRGIQPDQEGRAIVTADNRLDGLNLSFSEENGLFARYWQDWFWFLDNTLAVRYDVPMTTKEVATFDWKRKRHVRGNDYLVRSIEYEVTQNGITGAVRVELWQC